MTDTAIEEEVEKAASEVEEAPLVLASELLPAHLPILPIRPRPLFPGLPVPLEVGVEQVPCIQYALDHSSKTLGIVLVRDPNGSESPENLYQVGVAAKILRTFQGDGDTTEHSGHLCREIYDRKNIESRIRNAGRRQVPGSGRTAADGRAEGLRHGCDHHA